MKRFSRSIRISKQLLLLFLCLLISSAFLLYHEQDSRAEKAQTLRVVTYNIHHANPPSRPDSIDLDAIAKVIRAQQPDLVALQEIDVFTRRSGPFNEADELGKRTGLKAYFFKGIDYDGGEYGIAILSRFPVSESHRYPLPTKEGTGGEPRVLGTITATLPGGHRLLFACTHLDAQRDSLNRLLQINAIIGALKDSPLPVIISGDFNAPPTSNVIRILDKRFKRTCDPCAFTIPAEDPKKAIDFIAFTPSGKFKVKKHTVIPERYASDHLPVSAVLEVSW